MKIIKRILIAVAAIAALPLVVALFVKKEYTVTRDVVIGKPRQQVFGYVKHLRNQDHYSKWVMMDPGMKKTFHGTDGTVGFVYAWNGNDQAGEGEQEIKNLVDGESIGVEVRFKRPMETVGYAPMTLEDAGTGHTRVTWGMSGKSPYPLNFMNLFMDGMLGGDLDESLAQLKIILEQAH